MPLTKVLVTGGTGFLGSEIVKALIETKKHEVTVVDINPPALGTGSFSTVRYVRASVTAPSDLQKVFHEAKPDIVVHTVGVYPLGGERFSQKKRDAVFAVNLDGTRNVIQAAKDCGASGLVYTSSVTVLCDELEADFRNADETWSTGRAGTVYGQSKTAAENLVLAANSTNLRTCALRAAPIFGPNDPGTLPILHGCIARGESPFIIGDASNLVDFVYVSNVADAHVLAVRNLLLSGDASGEAFFITNGEPITARDFCLAVWKEFDHYPPFQISIPKGLAWWFGLGAEWVSWITGKEGTFSRGVINDATCTRYLSITKARTILGYTPKVKLPEALRVSCQYYKRQLEAQAKA